MHKKIILFILLVAALLTVALSYLNNFFLPVKLKGILIKKISQELERKVSIESLSYIPLKGIVAQNVQIAEKPPFQGTFLTIQEVAVNILSLPLLTQQRIVIPSIVISKPKIHIIKNKLGQWNSKDFFDLIQNQKDKKSFSFYIAKANLFEGTIIFSDRTLAQQPIMAFHNLTIEASVSLPHSAKLMIRLLPKKPGSLRFFSHLNYNFISGDFLSQMTIENFPLMDLLPYLKNTHYQIEQASLPLTALEVSRHNGKITGKGTVQSGPTTIRSSAGYLLKGLSSLTLENFTFSKEKFSAKGKLGIEQGSWLKKDQEKIQTDIAYDFSLNQKGAEGTLAGHIALQDLSSSFDHQLNFSTSAKGQATFSWNQHLFKAHTQLSLSNAWLNFPTDSHLKDSPHLEFLCIYNKQAKKEQWSYEGSLLFSSAQLTIPSWIEPVSALTGRIFLTPNKISTDSLSGLFKQMPFKIEGALTNFQKPSLNINGTVKGADLFKINEMVQQTFPDQKTQIRGLADLSFHYRGGLESLANSSLDLSASVQDASIKTNFFPHEISHLSGHITYQTNKFSDQHFLPGLATWNNLKLTFQDKTYILDGQLKFNDLSFSLASGDLRANAQIKILRDRLRILSSKTKYLDSSMNLRGEIFHRPGKKYKMHLLPEGTLRIEHLLEIFPEVKEIWSKFTPKGLCVIKGRFTGYLDQWPKATILGSAKSKELSVKGLKVNDFILDYRQRDRNIDRCTLSARSYSGSLKVKLKANLWKEPLPYQVNVELSDLNLNLLRKDIPVSNQYLSGIASLLYDGQGSLKDLDQMKGQGFLSIRKSELLQTELLKGLGQLLFLPKHQNIIAESIQGNFIIKNQKFFIENGLLKSNQMEVSCDGTIDFNGNLDLGLISRFDEGTIRGSQSLKKAVLATLSEGDPLIKVKVTGTLTNPQHYIIPQPLRILEKTRDFIFDGLLDIF